jgi:hypothetical protein
MACGSLPGMTILWYAVGIIALVALIVVFVKLRKQDG